MPATEQGKEYALAKLKERRDNRPEKIRDEELPAGAPMHFYCISCGWLAGTLPESYITAPPKMCAECRALQELGWLE